MASELFCKQQTFQEISKFHCQSMAYKSKLDLNEQDIKKLIIQKMFKDESSLDFKDHMRSFSTIH